MVQHAESSGPGDEIEFWHNRTIDLSGISDQLVRPGVQKIIEVLQIAKSSYLAPFQTLSDSSKAYKILGWKPKGNLPKWIENYKKTLGI